MKEKREGERSIVEEKDFRKEESNSCKYDGIIAMTLKCKQFIDTYGVIAILFI
jgi:hypothetical protein